LLNEFRGDGGPFVALWLDTWMRMLQSAGGHDSDAESVNASLKGCDRIRTALDCVVVMVAHVGVSKGAKGRPKGLSDTSAAVDGAIYCEKRGERSEALYSSKAINQRHAMEGFQMFFKLEKPSEELPSVVLRSARRGAKGLSRKTEEWFSALEKAMPAGLSKTGWRDNGVKLGIANNTKSANTALGRAIDELTKKRLIRVADEVFFVANDFDEDDAEADAFEE
jgi:RecA-family ATPase